MAIGSYKELTQTVSGELAQLRQSQSDVMTAFGQLAQAANKPGVLDKKAKEFVALGIAVAGRCDDCIGFHVKALVQLGATRAEIEEVLAVAVYMGGGPSLMYSTHALKAFEEFSA
ncbi:carboxymuconolactone decarboxylase family protein [Laribacter hongkongensis]|uniref:Alkylhydroperoxidase like protein, AhpD family n=2 Tax=Laribacter hongkongensis TaxID=168471 RepID=C1DA85_LARHH|nr:carboxymuconolactone decarboxylase family protein [Laribacter hongkongensis]MBP9526881.1 carboxymuconolactone decarboxylase family protein [Laribacter sp.]ACO75200.1 Alkylhydroperoxidase like protein, AhpD family [Laribacter hongkongensis HLHK9]ASJ25115.1 alkyl hydroperoxide reductase AhpD [Laribacter hongkongensis]MBE5530194.1 alkylhydroperoxidase [Laribacter hongkongensis]MBP9609308.1 carboxymuconolactone decarboxylase family protein [Laribacter sp.]